MAVFMPLILLAKLSKSTFLTCVCAYAFGILLDPSQAPEIVSITKATIQYAIHMMKIPRMTYMMILRILVTLSSLYETNMR